MTTQQTATKHKGVSRDTRGMQFEYMCYETHAYLKDKNYNFLEKNGLLVWGVVEKIYIDNVFFNRAGTLGELKKIMGAIG